MKKYFLYGGSFNCKKIFLFKFCNNTFMSVSKTNINAADVFFLPAKFRLFFLSFCIYIPLTLRGLLPLYSTFIAVVNTEN